MKKLVLAGLVSLLALCATPFAANAQSRAESRPNYCRPYPTRDVCTFFPAEDGGSALFVFTNSIRRADNDDAVNFVYLSSNSRAQRYAQVNCHESLDHWHRFGNNGTVDSVPVTSYAAHRMLNYVCEQSGHYLPEQTRR